MSDEQQGMGQPESSPQVPPQTSVPPVQGVGLQPIAYGHAGSGEYLPTQDEKTMAMLVWLLALLTGWIGPLILWLVKKDQSRFIDFHGKQALVLEVGMVVAMLILYVTCIGILLIFPLLIVVIVFNVIALMKANRGEWYRCPLVSWIIK